MMTVGEVRARNITQQRRVHSFEITSCVMCKVCNSLVYLRLNFQVDLSHQLNSFSASRSAFIAAVERRCGDKSGDAVINAMKSIRHQSDMKCILENNRIRLSWHMRTITLSNGCTLPAGLWRTICQIFGVACAPIQPPHCRNIEWKMMNEYCIPHGCSSVYTVHRRICTNAGHGE